ncbi:beta carbonic anhydrase 5, chloroplastic isoform X4 [Ziziphus jujuba]|uniref:Carbonic anhydrase n=1 Tax=Ziziphus jujuba TaxID=326968 RepID=A0ABM3IMZ3_ZIZJJ|nr:beta carbonic anhydrase 5, chloroplastic isoform X4 [Ziziphus jujuba]
MVWRIRSKARWIVPSMASLRPPSISKDSFHCPPLSGFTSSLVGLPKRSLACSDPKNQLIYSAEAGENHSGLLPSVDRVDLFGEMKMRFLSFKKHKYLEEREHFRTLAEAQAPKFMVIACADSRVCPSNILGFQPGEAFIIRNVANLVPPLENGPSETNAALEFAVNTLQVENILVIGHSRCGGIETLMSMQDDDNSSFIHSWIIKAKTAKLRAKAAVPHLNFEQQCRHCERESINNSLMNLLTYPWIEERAKKDMLSIHGGYYDFLNCTFEKWDLDAKNSNVTEKGARYLVKDTMYWY